VGGGSVSYTETYVDGNGVELKIGDRVDAGDGVPGTIRAFSDPDGDVDDEGRPINIPPYATVLFDDGVEERYPGHWAGKFYDDDALFEFDDFEKIKEG
jgi:hypothetical protein